MFSKGRTYFRFRFHLSRVLLLAFLLNSPTQAFFLPGECVEVLKNPSLAALTNDPGKVPNEPKRLYSGTPLYGHPLNTDTRFIRTVSFVPTKSSYIFSKINPLYTDTG